MDLSIVTNYKLASSAHKTVAMAIHLFISHDCDRAADECQQKVLDHHCNSKLHVDSSYLYSYTAWLWEAVFVCVWELFMKSETWFECYTFMQVYESACLEEPFQVNIDHWFHWK